MFGSLFFPVSRLPPRLMAIFMGIVVFLVCLGFSGICFIMGAVFVLIRAGVPEWPKGQDSRSSSSGFRGFESLPPHLFCRLLVGTLGKKFSCVSWCELLLFFWFVTGGVVLRLLGFLGFCHLVGRHVWGECFQWVFIWVVLGFIYGGFKGAIIQFVERWTGLCTLQESLGGY